MVKVNIISGFLGAGKTTLIRKLLKEALNGDKTVLIENEFGEIGIDAGFLQEGGVEIREMNSGCICCSLVGDFKTSLQEVLQTYAPERIIIEPSGVGKLSEVVQAVEAASDHIHISGKVTVVDVNKCKMYLKNFGEFFLNQVTEADTILLSRTGTASAEKVQKAVELLREHNDHAVIVTTPWEQLDGKDLLAELERSVNMEAELLAEVEAHHHEHHHEHGEHCTCGHDHHHHHADEVFVSWGMETPAVYTKEKVEAVLNALGQEDVLGLVLRAKGMVPAEDGSWIYFDYVPEEAEIREGKPAVTGKICVIGSGLKQDALEALLKA